MRTALGSGLLLLALSGLVAVPATADAATACDAPDTTWVGPASADGDRSWAVASNWSNGVPVSSSKVCVPAGTNADPEVPTGTTVTVAVVDASAAGVEVAGGSLTVTGSWEAERLAVHGGDLVLSGPAVLGDAVVDADGRVLVEGVTHLTELTQIQMVEDGLGTLEVAPTGSLILVSKLPGANVEILGDLVNHGTVEAITGHIDAYGLPLEEIPEGHQSDGDFVSGSGWSGSLRFGPVVLGDGARLIGARVTSARIPRGATVTSYESLVLPLAGEESLSPALTGAGELVLRNSSIAAGGVGEQVTVRVPARDQSWVVERLEDRARLVVEGRAYSPNGDLAVLDDAVLEVQEGGTWDTTSEPYSESPMRLAPFGRIVVHDGGRLVGGGEGTLVRGVLENHGTVRAAGGPVDVLDPSGSFHDGVLTSGRWEVGPGAELELAQDASVSPLPAGITRNEAEVALEGEGSVFRGLDALRTNAWSGSLEIGRRATLPISGTLRNAGNIDLDAAGRLETTGGFAQTAAGSLQLGVAARAVGRIVAEGVRNLAGTLVLSPASGAWPPVDARRLLITSDGRATPRDAFDFVRAPRIQARTAQVDYRADRVWLRVVADPLTG